MKNHTSLAQKIIAGECSLGIELGSTRIKAVLIDDAFSVVATGGFAWKSSCENDYFTYSYPLIEQGLATAFADLNTNIKNSFGVTLTKLRAAGISAMMHGYLPLDEQGNPVAPFRTWQNTNTTRACEELSAALNFNIPQRWSIAHLYQAILDNEPHLKSVRRITTLAGYIHWRLTGENTVGIGEASGMFPVAGNDYDEELLAVCDRLLSGKIDFSTRELLPRVLLAGDTGGKLTANGSRWLDPTGTLQAGALMCPPEGDAGTGMVATNAVATRTGNVSAGTSVFAMVVLEKKLSRPFAEIDLVATPTGAPVAMIHANNCTIDFNAWAEIFRETAKLFGTTINSDALFSSLYKLSLKGDPDCGGLTSINYLSGEPITKIPTGRPLLIRTPSSNFSLPNLVKSLLYSSLCTLAIGMETLNGENVKVDNIVGHGGFFKTEPVGQRLMAAALNCPVSVMKNAGEGGAWGIALLAAFAAERQNDATILLEKFLTERVFAEVECSTLTPDQSEVSDFNQYLARYRAALIVERTAGEAIC